MIRWNHRLASPEQVWPEPARPANKGISVVVPVKGHPVLIDDALASVHREMAAGIIRRLIVVNDGCTFAETRSTLTAWQATLGDRIRVLNCKNGGLSAARNRGIAAALELDPEIEAVFLLDADNVLAPGAGTAMRRLLNNQPDADWFYPDFDFFGQHGHYITDRDPDLLFHAQINLCEAGSLIRRRVFEAGIRFDEEMKRGYEDWDFWLQAAQAGFRGQSAAQPLLLYRKRPVSMLSNSHDADGELRRYLETKHRWLFSAPKLLELEAARFPRFAVIEGDGQSATLLTDPGQGTDIPLRELERLVMAHFAEPFANHAPAYIVFLRDGLSARLRENRMLHNFLWISERRWSRFEDRPDIDLFFLDESDDGHRIVTDHGNPERAADGVVIDIASLRNMLDAPEDWLRQVDRAPTPVKATSWHLAIEGMVPLDRKTVGAAELLRSFLLLLSRSRFRAALDQKWEWREVGGAVDRGASARIPRRMATGGVVFPLLKQAGLRDIGFVLPIFDFGGVEKVVASMAREFEQSGYRCHLFVISDRPIHPDSWALKAFTTVNWMPDASAIDWSGTEFLGTAEPSWGNRHEKADLIGLLSSMDVVINAHSGALHKVADHLRRGGVTMIDHQHLLERSTYGRSYGPPKLALAYESAYDLILTCSEAMRVWLHGNGIPREKLLPVVNAPGYPLAPAAARSVMEKRETHPRQAPLRVLFMGRLDPQKGVHRLSSVYHGLSVRAPQIQLTIAGGSVVDAGEAAFSFPSSTNLLGPVRGPHALTRLLAETDVMILPSHYEGLPLSVLEAQRCGVVVIATDVGAMEEAIVDGTTGFIVPEHGCEETILNQVLALDADRDLLARVSLQAARMTRDWTKALAPLQSWLLKVDASAEHQRTPLNPVKVRVASK